MTPSADETEAGRREQPLDRDYEVFLLSRNHSVVRHRCQPKDGRPLFYDLFDESDRVLVETKGSVTRSAIRMAIGQLADYWRYEDPDTRRRILLTSRPRADLENLLLGEGISIAYRTGDGFGLVQP